MACALVWTVFVTSAFGALLDCGMHGRTQNQATTAGDAHPHCESHCPTVPGGSHHGQPRGHQDEHPSAACCHAKLYNAPVGDGVPTVARSSLSVVFTPVIRDTPGVGSATASPTARGGEPPGGWSRNVAAFSERPLFLSALSLLI